MEKEFIPYAEALALKELGFESPYPIGGYQGGKVFYYENGNLYYDSRPMYSSDAHSGQLSAPLYQQAFRWFREKYNLFGCIDLHISTPIHWYIRIDDIIKNDYIYHSEDVDLKFDTYEEAELECLKKLIEITNGNNN